jgi:hypothetical protein
MSLGISLALTLGAGLYADAGLTRHRQRFSAHWGKTEVFVANASAWDLTRARAWQYTTGWSIRFAQNHQSPYGLRLEGGHRVLYGDLRVHHRQVALPYGDAHLTRAQHRVVYTDLGRCQMSFRAPYWLTQRVEVAHQLAYAVTTVDPVTQRLIASWSLLDDARLQAVVNNPELIWQGQKIRIVQATLSCDEDSPVWIAQIEVAEVADFAMMAIGDAITLTLGLETFALVVDGKTLSRESSADPRCNLTAVSPLAWRDAPFAGTTRYYESAAIPAETAVENLIGPVSWQLPDWLIPPNRLLLDNVTPLAAARNIVAAIGGIIESAPDGSVVCRRRHPVSVPQYGQTLPASSLFDADVLSVRAQIAPQRGYNRVTLANEEGAAASATDRVEYVADADDLYRGTVRAYLSVSRLASLVRLVHTGHAATVLASLGAVTRTESETVEFSAGQASTRYPVTAITGSTWQHADLGPVSAEGQTLVAATPGYSLLRLTYTTTSLDWRVALSVDEEVQFVLTDA